jgi:hypothetical protein
MFRFEEYPTLHKDHLNAVWLSNIQINVQLERVKDVSSYFTNDKYNKS